MRPSALRELPRIRLASEVPLYTASKWTDTCQLKTRHYRSTFVHVCVWCFEKALLAKHSGRIRRTHPPESREISIDRLVKARSNETLAIHYIHSPKVDPLPLGNRLQIAHRCNNGLIWIMVGAESCTFICFRCKKKHSKCSPSAFHTNSQNWFVFKFPATMLQFQTLANTLIE